MLTLYFSSCLFCHQLSEDLESKIYNLNHQSFQGAPTENADNRYWYVMGKVNAYSEIKYIIDQEGIESKNHSN